MSQYLTFQLAAEGYGVPIGRVRSIIGYAPVTPVPGTPPHVRGVINLRGQVLPVIDLRLRLGLPSVEPTGQTCVIVVETLRGGLAAVLHGLIVDRVCEVPVVPAASVTPPPAFGAGVDGGLVLGLAKIGQAVQILLDLDAVLALPAAEAA